MAFAKRNVKGADVNIPAISKHLNNIFSDEELEERVVVSKMENTTIHGAIEGKTQTSQINMYNLDAIIAVGYRVNSKKATEFRIWATKILKNSGNVSHKQAIEKANNEYEKYRIIHDQKYISSMDEMYNKYLEESKDKT